MDSCKVGLGLLDYATETQAVYIKAVHKYGSSNKAAKALGKVRRTVDMALERVKANAARQGYSPEHDMTHPVPDGFHLKGISTLYGDDGEPKIQWVKTSVDAQRQKELFAEAITALSSSIKPEPRAKAPKKTLSDILNFYPITDYHLGMLSWDEETGDNWDIKIAEDLLVAWFATAIKQSPDSETAVFAQMGDFLHTDGLEAVTPASHNVLDADSRFQKIVRVAIRVLRRVVRMLLEKHKNVHIIMAEGNHDPASSIWLREWFHALYEDEPRVTVDLSPDPYYCYEFGATSLFVHHGHKKKLAALDVVFAAKFRSVFGRTTHSYGHMGHFHNKQVIESNIMLLEQHRTLASPDAYASRGGWLSGRDASVITYHNKYGEVGRITVSPDRVKG